MVIALFCLTVAKARLMFAEFLVWFALPALSSAPHLDGHHFSVNGASLTGPLRACAMTTPTNPARTTTAMLESFMLLSPSQKRSFTPLLSPTPRNVGDSSYSADARTAIGVQLHAIDAIVLWINTASVAPFAHRASSSYRPTIRPVALRQLVHDVVLACVLDHLQPETVVRPHFGRGRMIDLDGLDSLAEVGGVSADVDHVTDAERAGLQPQDRD